MVGHMHHAATCAVVVATEKVLGWAGSGEEQSKAGDALQGLSHASLPRHLAPPPLPVPHAAPHRTAPHRTTRTLSVPHTMYDVGTGMFLYQSSRVPGLQRSGDRGGTARQQQPPFRQKDDSPPTHKTDTTTTPCRACNQLHSRTHRSWGSGSWHAWRGLPHTAHRVGRNCTWWYGSRVPHQWHCSSACGTEAWARTRGNKALATMCLHGRAWQAASPLIMLVDMHPHVGPPQEGLCEGRAVVQPHPQLNQRGAGAQAHAVHALHRGCGRQAAAGAQSH